MTHWLFLYFSEVHLLMNRFIVLLILLFFIGVGTGNAQISADCVDAVAICNNTPINGGTNGFGIDDFGGAASSGCLERSATGLIESNTAWYRFRTGASGQLGFNIGFDASEDWDFALYRASDCNTLGAPVRCNFFDNSDANSFLGVGEDPTGDQENFQYEPWLTVTPGEEYYLMINNFSNTNSGFSIQFSGSIFITNPFDALDCSIVNNLLGPPIAACEGQPVTLDATTPNGTYDWAMDTGSGFQPITGEHNATLAVNVSATYQVQVTTPLGNTIFSEVQVAFSEVPVAEPVSDIAACSGATTIDLSEKDAEVLGAQDPNVFVVSYYGDLGDANNGVNSLPKLYPATAGSETIYVRIAAIDNPNCFDVTEQFQLINLESPSLDFPQEVFLCGGNGNVKLGSEVAVPNYSYVWDTGEMTPSITVDQTGVYTVTVTNMVAGLSCESTRTVTVSASNPPEILDIQIEDLQANNTVTVVANTAGDWEYQLDDGQFQTGNRFENVAPGPHRITVSDPGGCGSVSETIVVVGFPKYFTPNGDGANDRWYIVGAELLENVEVAIFNRYGKLLKVLRDDEISGWDGTFNNRKMPGGDYWFRLTYTAPNGQHTVAKYVNNHFSLKR